MNSAHSKLRAAFCEACDPEAYVPRPATQAALARLSEWLHPPALGPTLAILFGPAGIGKTFLLRRLEAARPRSRRGESRALYLPYAGMGPEDLCLWVYGSLGRSETLDAPRDPAEAFTRLAALPGRGVAPFLLLIDDADSMPSETLEMLQRADAGPRPAHRLRIVLALNDDARGSRLLGALQGQQPLEVALRDRLTLEETGDYVRGRLRFAGFSEREIRRVGDDTIGWIHALSSGLPRRVHRVATQILEDEGGSLPGALDAKRRREGWMGRPIEDDEDTGEEREQ